MQLARGDPTIELVDTRPALDGRPDYFIDLVHLTQEGRQRLAETILAGIAPCLTNILAGTPQSSSGRNAE
jgi:phospholipase/lecithinase/hemolysin